MCSQHVRRVCSLLPTPLCDLMDGPFLFVFLLEGVSSSAVHVLGLCQDNADV